MKKGGDATDSGKRIVLGDTSRFFNPFSSFSGERREKCDIFISYRRDGGSEAAKHLRDTLTMRGYRVFLDVNSLGSGPFDEALYRRIEQCTDFLLVVSPGSLARCEDESDWVRKEIEHARKRGKNIVPIRLQGVSSSDPIPSSVSFIKSLNGPNEPRKDKSNRTDIEYYDAFISRIVEFLHTPTPRPWWERWLAFAVAAVLICALGVAGYLHFSTYPHNRSQENLVSSLISYMTLNLSKADAAIGQYQQDMSRALRYFENEATGSKSESETDLRLDLYAHGKAIQENINSVTSMSEQLRTQLMNSPFDVGDLDAFPPVLVDIMSEYAEKLAYVRDDLIPNDALRNDFKSNSVNFFKEMSELDAELLFYQFNETLLPVTNEKALSVLKKEYLPEMTALFSKRLDMSHDGEAIRGKMEAIFQQYAALFERYEQRVQDEEKYVNAQELEAAITTLIAAEKRFGLDTSELEATWERITGKRQALEESKEELADTETQITALRKEMVEKFKPLEDDSVETLWGKGTRFLTVNMPREAGKCFAMCAEKGDGMYKIAAVAAEKFAENCTALNIKGGVVVCGYEENLPHQAVELGDIIYEAEGQALKNWTEYSTATQEDGVYAVSVLRFTPSDYELLTTAIDKSLGRLYLLGLNDEPYSESQSQ